MAHDRGLRITSWRSLGALPLAIASFALVAQEKSSGSAELPQLIYDPVPIVRVPPNYPNKDVNARREGWVQMSFITSKTGEVTEAMIEDSSGGPAFDAAAMAALQKWRYKPATIDGQPVEHSAQTIIRFQLSGVPRASKKFMASFNEIRTLLAAKDVAKATVLMAALRSEEDGRNSYEDAWFWWLEYLYLDVTNGPVQQRLDALGKAIGPEPRFLYPDLFVFASARLFTLRVEGRDFSGALAAYKRLTDEKTVQKTKEYAQVQPRLATTVAEIGRIVASDATMMLPGRVNEHDYWVHSLLRRSFSLGNIQGALDHLSIRCSHRNVTFTPVTDQNTWTIPESYGDCSVYLKGVEGATFDFYELPATAANTTTTPASSAPNSAE